jgi:hypothetical protein
MKKLESLKDAKFSVTGDELLQIKGGYGDPSIQNTYDTSTTRNSDGTTSSDRTYADSCVDW